MENLPPHTLALVIDNRVVDILHTDERLAAIFLSEPTVVDITGLEVAVGQQYVGGEFLPVEPEQAPNV